MINVDDPITDKRSEFSSYKCETYTYRQGEIGQKMILIFLMEKMEKIKIEIKFNGGDYLDQDHFTSSVVVIKITKKIKFI